MLTQRDVVDDAVASAPPFTIVVGGAWQSDGD